MSWIKEQLSRLKVSAIDTLSLQKYSELDPTKNEPLVITLLDLYFDRAPQLVTKLKIAIESDDVSAVSYSMQTLGTISATMGAKKLAQLCLSTARNLSCEEAALTRLEGIFHSISKEYEIALNELKEIRESIQV